MPQLFDITNWNEQRWYSTGGTRSKKYVQSPDGKFYYFKKSYKTQGRDYFYEFWSEIIASELGLKLGFNMLQYDIAVNGDDMGCISESMVNTEIEELIEGGKYLRAAENRFTPEVKDTRRLYSLQLIDEAFNMFNLNNYMDGIIEIIVFDALIGNGDRHQENWAFINLTSFLPEAIKEVESAMKDGALGQLPKWITNSPLFRKIFDYERTEITPDGRTVHLYFQKTRCFAPIYDSGSSLGRELTDEKIDSVLKNNPELNAYINRGVSEIHWENRKLNHFDLIAELLNSKYAEIVKKVIKRVLEKFDEKDVVKMINEVDTQVPDSLNRFKLKELRKCLIIKLITLRYERLKSLNYA